MFIQRKPHVPNINNPRLKEADLSPHLDGSSLLARNQTIIPSQWLNYNLLTLSFKANLKSYILTYVCQLYPKWKSFINLMNSALFLDFFKFLQSENQFYTLSFSTTTIDLVHTGKSCHVYRLVQWKTSFLNINCDVTLPEVFLLPYISNLS